MDRRTYMQLLGRMYMRPLSSRLMATYEVEPSSVEMMDTSAAAVTETLSLVPNSRLSFNLEENGLMKILQLSQGLNGASTMYITTMSSNCTSKKQHWDGSYFFNERT